MPPPTTTVAAALAAIESFAPLTLAEPWDNVGLILGDGGAPLAGPVFLAIDLTEEVAREAIAARAAIVIAYHPPIFHPLKRLTTAHARQRSLLALVRAGCAVYSPHTALDAVAGGVTDWLCDMLAPDPDTARGFADRRALTPHAAADLSATHKLVTFVPAAAADEVRNALASIGAGHIGEYELCSFTAPGEGAFRGSTKSRPAVGRAGALERVAELRLEMVCPASAIPLAVEMLRQFHPYEEPPLDIYALTPRPSRRVGAGRRLHLDHPLTPRELAKNLKTNLGVDAVKLAAAGDKPVSTVGVVPGAGAALLEAAIADGCELFVTGEVKHHEALGAVERGVSILLAGHTNTERGFLKRYAKMIEGALPAAQVMISKKDVTLFRTLSF